MPATASFGVGGDREGWETFLASGRRVVDDYGNLPFVHWCEDQKGRVTDPIGRFGDPARTAARLRGNLVNLLPIIPGDNRPPVSEL